MTACHADAGYPPNHLVDVFVGVAVTSLNLLRIAFFAAGPISVTLDTALELLPAHIIILVGVASVHSPGPGSAARFAFVSVGLAPALALAAMLTVG